MDSKNYFANTIEEYFGTLLQSVTEMHEAHLKTSKYSSHIALNEFYDEMPELVDSLIECYQGINGKVENYKNNFHSVDFRDEVEYLEVLRDFTKDGREKFLDDVSELESCADDILSQIDSTLYKLKELKENKNYGMKNLNQFLSESLNEARNTPYRVSLNGVEDSEGYPLSLSITLDDPKDAKIADKWFEEKIGDIFEHVGGGPNNIEL